MMQAFEWYIDGDGKHWKLLEHELPKLSEMGITGEHHCRWWSPLN